MTDLLKHVRSCKSIPLILLTNDPWRWR